MSYELVRVSTEMVERLIADESEPAVIVGLERFEDGTCDMHLKTTDVIAELSRLRAAYADLLDLAGDMRCYVPDYFAQKWKHDEALAEARAMATTQHREEA